MKGSVAIVRDPTAPDDEQVAIEEIRLAEVWEGEVILLKRAHLSADEQQPFGLAWLVGQVLRERKLFVDIGAGAIASTIFAIAPPFIVMIVHRPGAREPLVSRRSMCSWAPSCSCCCSRPCSATCGAC